ncbi:OadG family protein [Vibrio salinus]|uniref:OadG family protein n=1 Tax=Vibrio salinus TaxID=2899784 RepID=UPI001E39C242|nr:OadG family protein [Vibrio salinus]MCE0492796.1 OadG family protein [Vibrio salinus]
MNEGPIILEGVTLMTLGMGFVFIFLLILVGAIKLLAVVAMRFDPVQKPSPAGASVSSNPTSDDSLIAAISVALHHHKKNFS